MERIGDGEMNSFLVQFGHLTLNLKKILATQIQNLGKESNALQLQPNVKIQLATLLKLI